MSLIGKMKPGLGWTRAGWLFERAAVGRGFLRLVWDLVPVVQKKAPAALCAGGPFCGIGVSGYSAAMELLLARSRST